MNPTGARLLVVEDEPNIRELLATSLRYAGFDVATAASGSEALRVAGDHHPDLCVLDVTPEGLKLVELAPDAPEDDVREKTESALI